MLFLCTCTVVDDAKSLTWLLLSVMLLNFKLLLIEFYLKGERGTYISKFGKVILGHHPLPHLEYLEN